MSDADGPVRLERDGPLAVVTLASPPLNLFDDAMFAGLRAAVDAVAAEPSRALLFRAEGRAVSGGFPRLNSSCCRGSTRSRRTFSATRM